MTGTSIQRRRGTTAEHAAFTGALGEITVDTIKKTAAIHDGVTAGGLPLAREDLSNVSSIPYAKLSSDLQGATFGFKNRLINGAGLINQRGVSGTVTLAAGVYGHDRFKAGASGCTYTFLTTGNVTTLTISAGSLIQVVEGLNLETGTYCLGWTGTCQGKIGAGSYATSGVTGSITGGTNTNIEFNTGTLSLPQLEKGSTATAFDYRPYGTELMLCQRYYQSIPAQGVAYSTVAISPTLQTQTTMRATATATFSGSLRSTADSTSRTATTPAIGVNSTTGTWFYLAAASWSIPLVVGVAYDGLNGATITFSAEL